MRGTDTKYREMQLVKAGDLIYPKLGAWEGAFSFVDLSQGRRGVPPPIPATRATSSAS